ncbi:MAG TPA: alpha/beta fold hydrolase [Gammaproteobacteria bacterium]|jgi:pimeloyl-ACP methyl ester carboxylesterase|nr:alpha/beta fold hydrolase [Gammaproteobacteria bacterium]
MKDTVILVHGLWMTELVMRPLAHQLERTGYQPVPFGYRSLRNTIHTNAQELAQTVRRTGAQRVHLVGHSLGGLVILQALADAPELINGRVVLLGTPVNGSVVARRLHGRKLSRWLVGRGAEDRLARGGAGWHGKQQIGTIAGTRPVGVGRVLGGLSGPNDGTVTVAETTLAGCRDTLLLPVTHMGLLLSRKVAAAVNDFLRSGHFSIGG